jgi:hypothetical protein
MPHVGTVDRLRERAKVASDAHTNLFLSPFEAYILADLITAVQSTGEGHAIIRGIEMRCRMFDAAEKHSPREPKTE